MCNVSAGVFEEGYVKGLTEQRARIRAEVEAECHAACRTEERLTSLRSILNKTTFTFDEAADMLSIPEYERDVYRQKLGIND